jgi:hypothetical protein
MAETRDSRAERREEIKLRLEYLKVAISLGVIGTILFAGLQWQIANQAAARANQIANEAVYQRMTNEWRDHLKTFVDKEKAALRPYFEEKKQLASDDPNRQVVLALADVRLDVMDAILTYATMRGYGEGIKGWKITFANAFRTSPAVCSRLIETQSNYGLVVPIAREACQPPPANR